MNDQPRPSVRDKRLIAVMVALHAHLPKIVDELLACELSVGDRMALAKQLERVAADLCVDLVEGRHERIS